MIYLVENEKGWLIDDEKKWERESGRPERNVHIWIGIVFM